MPDQREDTRRTPLSGSTNAAAFTTGAGADAGRGRQAAAPWYIPWNGWKDIFLRTYQQANEDRLLAVAAGVVFYGLAVRSRWPPVIGSPVFALARAVLELLTYAEVNAMINRVIREACKALLVKRRFH